MTPVSITEITLGVLITVLICMHAYSINKSGTNNFGYIGAGLLIALVVLVITYK